MSACEGKLEAPTRHALDWKAPAFHDKDACFAEMKRVLDICRGCCRCVSPCQPFLTQLDLVDATTNGEVHGVKKEAYWNVVDQCLLCDLCHVVLCRTCRHTPGSWIFRT